MGFSLLPSPLHMSQQAKAAPNSQNRKSLNFQDKIDRKSKVSKPSDVETVETVEAAEATRAGTRKEPSTRLRIYRASETRLVAPRIRII